MWGMCSSAIRFAGGMSMATGEYVSVSSQRDTERADLAVESDELARNLRAGSHLPSPRPVAPTGRRRRVRAHGQRRPWGPRPRRALSQHRHPRAARPSGPVIRRQLRTRRRAAARCPRRRTPRHPHRQCRADRDRRVGHPRRCRRQNRRRPHRPSGFPCQCRRHTRTRSPCWTVAIQSSTAAGSDHDEHGLETMLIAAAGSGSGHGPWKTDTAWAAT